MPLINRCGGGSAELQSKTVSPSTSEQTVTPDSGYDGLSQVIVSAAKLQSKTVSPSTSSQTVTPSSGYYGLSSVSVNAISTQSKTVTPSASSQTVYPDSGKYLSSVIVNAMSGGYVGRYAANTSDEWYDISGDPYAVSTDSLDSTTNIIAILLLNNKNGNIESGHESVALWADVVNNKIIELYYENDQLYVQNTSTNITVLSDGVYFNTYKPKGFPPGYRMVIPIYKY